MELHQLRYFLTTLDEGSFSRAAVKHRLTQQAISKSISRLEQELGTKLFLRDGRQIKPTAAGQMLAEHAQMIDAESHRFQRHLGELLGTTPGELQIGAGPTAARRLVAEAVQRLLDDRPEIRIAVSAGTTR
ncbi:MAG TPA: LysR family transcriptional regulator, partial [Steroidobacteraceae bacterium]|nr:LysR family transcriptional regulator [Steroidobacteraceae bacterium]